MLAWFTTVLAEAYLAAGDPERTHETASRGLALAREAAFPYGLGLATRALGRLARARGQHDEAARLLECRGIDQRRTRRSRSLTMVQRVSRLAQRSSWSDSPCRFRPGPVMT
jgi:hypothetical protein